MSQDNSTPAAGAAADPTAADLTGGEPAPAVETPKPRYTVEVKNGVKSVTFVKPVKFGPKAETPAPAAGGSSRTDTAGKADESAPAQGGKASTTDQPAPKKSADPSPKSSASGKPDESGKESGKPTEKPADKPPLSKGYAALLDREAAVTKRDQELKTERETLQREYAPFVEGREIGKTSKLKAVEKAFGWTLDDLQGEYVQSLAGTLSPEQIAERTARRLLEERDEADKKKAEEDRAAEEQRLRDEADKKFHDCAGSMAEVAGKMLDQLPVAMALGKTYGDVIAWHWNQHHQLPTDHAAALTAYEAHLQAALGSKGFTKAPPAPAATPAPASERRTAPTVQVKTSPTITSEDAGEVPISRNGPKETPMQRAERLVRERLQRSSSN